MSINTDFDIFAKMRREAAKAVGAQAPMSLAKALRLLNRRILTAVDPEERMKAEEARRKLLRLIDQGLARMAWLRAQLAGRGVWP